MDLKLSPEEIEITERLAKRLDKQAAAGPKHRVILILLSSGLFLGGSTGILISVKDMRATPSGVEPKLLDYPEGQRWKAQDDINSKMPVLMSLHQEIAALNATELVCSVLMIPLSIFGFIMVYNHWSDHEQWHLHAILLRKLVVSTLNECKPVDS